MKVFEVIVAMLIGGAILTLIARRISAPYPALVALAGAGLALIPGVPTVILDPELALALFVAPVLVDAAFDASQRDMRKHWRPIASLAVGAVVLTVAVVAIVAKLAVPTMPWGAAIALGAIVAPPDAAAATTVLKALRPPNRLLVILEGETLFNDASALLIYRMAVGAVVTGQFSGWSVLPMLLLVTVGSIALALVLSRVTLFLTGKITDLATAVVFQFCGAFLVWILAEHLHLSGIITTVVFAMAVSRRAPEVMPARIRLPAFAVWEVAVFVLNVLAFILIGLQLKGILARVNVSAGLRYAAFATAVTLAVILARMLWVTGAAAISRWRCRPGVDGLPRSRDSVALTSRGAIAVGWCGMRGTVTLAAALALPAAFPFRDLILATAFAVTLGTLVFQGLTLKPLLDRLKLKDDGAVDREIRMARVASLKAALAEIDAHEPTESVRYVRLGYDLQLRRAESHPEDDLSSPKGGGDDEKIYSDVVRAALDVQRRQLVAMRSDGTIGDTAFQRLEEELDWMDVGWAQVVGPADEAAAR
jgi:CPA1 family monovalent cation:H+ antiporter